MSSQPVSAANRFGTLEQARATLLANFGYPDFRPPQIRAVEAALSGQDALLVLPTGGGKSLCYQVPALMRDGLTVVVSPLISLMKDQVDALERRGLSAAFINSTLDASAVADRMAQARDGTLKLLYLSPERMDAGRTLDHLVAIGVALLAVDEAHCISEWGHDFRPSYRRIGLLRERMGNPQTLALTATATPGVRDDIVRQLALRNPTVVVAGFDRTNLTYHVAPKRSQRDKDTAAIRLLRGVESPSIVYAPTRKAVERVAATLVRGGVQAIAYHAGLDDRLRQRVQDAFMRERVRVIVATSAFGMGIDKPDVRLVVHHAMPGSLEAYYQEAGRAGRDGNPSTCILLYSYPDRFTHEFFIAGSHPDQDTVEQTWRLLRGRADGDGRIPLTADQFASRMPSSIGERKAGAALRTLIAAGVMTVEPPSMRHVWIRLLASPGRITRELVAARAPDRTVLRALWRASRGRIQQGVVIDLRTLPREPGTSAGAMPTLERLQAEQFLTFSRTGAGIRLDPRFRDPDWLPVDWPALARRRSSELARLDAMQGYAATRYCRRAFVLRYFGDPEARPTCGACDRCLAETAETTPRSLTVRPTRATRATRASRPR